jgi:hypothetical protein
MAVVNDVRRTDIRLHMYSYYCTVAWQVFAIFVAAAVVLATLPFVANMKITNDPTLFRGYFVINESYAGLLVLIGLLFQRRNLDLAHRWVHFDGEIYSSGMLQYWMDIIEQGRPSKPHNPPPISTLTGRHYVAIFVVLVFSYVLTSIILLFLIPN